MAEKLLVTQALDEKDLLVKRIGDKIDAARFVDTVKNNEETVYRSRLKREDFADKAKAEFQQIQDLIARYERIDAAIVASNAATTIETSYGTFTVAAAISLRSRLQGKGTADQQVKDFEGLLLRKMSRQYDMEVAYADDRNKAVQATSEDMRLSILGKDTKVKDDKPLEVVDAYVRENTTVLADPLDIKQKMTEISDRRDNLLRELDTQIKVSNATTYIEI